MYADHHLLPWLESLLKELDGIPLLDAHTHVGANDPDGFRCSPEELVDALSLTGSRAVVFSMQEPAGYAKANDDIIAGAAASNGRLIPFCRVDPADDPLAEATRCVGAGACGIKLHPRAESFTLDDPRLDGIFAFADAHRLPVLVHAGRGIPALGKHALRRCRDFPDARIILAHAGISDLTWIWRVAPDHPNLFFDTAWWNAADLLMLFAYLPPGRILFASDVPYATSTQGVIATMRCAFQAGLTKDQMASVAGGQMERLLKREEPLDLGPPSGIERLSTDLVLARAYSFLMIAIGRIGAGRTGERVLSLARLACDVGDDMPLTHVCRSITALLDRHELYIREGKVDEDRHSFSNMHLVATASVVAMTPDVPLPALV